MATLPLSTPKFRAFDTNGDPLSGGKLYSYAAGTSTPLDTYTTRAGGVANANPVVLDANGEADVWTAPGVLYKFELKNSLGVLQWSVDNVPSGISGTGDAGSTSDAFSTIDPGGRLTLTSGTPVTTSGVTGATTVFYTPHLHNQIPIYDGSTWTLNTFASELSQALSDTTKSPAAATTGNVYDMFIWLDAGTLRLSRGPLWTLPESARGTGAGTTELERVNGRYVNKYAVSNGPSAHLGLYVGTIRVSAGSGGVDDNAANRHVWNAYHRVKRHMHVNDPALSWIYSTDTWRQANANIDNQLDFVIGLPGDSVRADVLVVGRHRNDAGSSTNTAMLRVGIGLDSATANSATLSTSIESIAVYPSLINVYKAYTLSAVYEGSPGIGRHYLVWMERSWNNAPADGDTTWYGQGGTVLANSGMAGHVFA